MAALSAAWRQPQRSGTVRTIAGLRAVVEKSYCAHVAGPEPRFAWHVGMRVFLASMSSIVHQLAFALYAWDVSCVC